MSAPLPSPATLHEQLEALLPLARERGLRIAEDFLRRRARSLRFMASLRARPASEAPVSPVRDRT